MCFLNPVDLVLAHHIALCCFTNRNMQLNKLLNIFCKMMVAKCYNTTSSVYKKLCDGISDDGNNMKKRWYQGQSL